MSEHVSMEEFGPVSVDYFTQRTVTEVSENPEGSEGEPFWTITFEGNGQLLNFSPTIPAPDASLVGKALNKVIMGPGNQTRLYFGTSDNPTGTEMTLDPMHYAIMDENYTGGKVVFAQRSVANMPPPHPDDRIASGPTPAEDDPDDGA